MLAVASLLDSALDRQLRRDVGISHVTFVILSVLATQPDRTLSMTTLARLTNSSQSRLSHAVARLEERGWVIRAKDEISRRLVNATLTDAGDAVLVEAAPGHVATVRQLVFSQLAPAQVTALHEVNSIILAALADSGYADLVPEAIRPAPDSG